LDLADVESLASNEHVPQRLPWAYAAQMSHTYPTFADEPASWNVQNGYSELLLLAFPNRRPQAPSVAVAVLLFRDRAQV
jgi:hypothetical protein